MITAKKKKSIIPAVLITAAAFLLLAGFVLAVLNNASEASREEALNAVRENVVRAAVSCYACEGAYPDSLTYLEENYNLFINKNKYIVHYEKAGDNLMPNIYVIERGAGY
ncbi:MAG: hypothetical protein FWD34_02490 [Oscillospiraceae bacterium]|nr:hypothetical protein [Oscillospiraceae bacterium]